MRMLESLARLPQDRVALTLFVNQALLEAHPDLVEAFATVVAPLTSGRAWPVSEGRPGGDRGHLAGSPGPAPSASTCCTTWAARCPSCGAHPASSPSTTSSRSCSPSTSAWSSGRTCRPPCRRRSVGPWRSWCSPSGRGRRRRTHRHRSRARASRAPRHRSAHAGRSRASRWPLATATASPTSPFFLYPAITYAHKNHVGLVRAFARVAEADDQVKLVLTGGAADAEEAVQSEIVDARAHRPGGAHRPHPSA